MSVDSRRDAPASWPTGGSMPTQARVAQLGRLGRYRLCVELASGGMGTVHLARAEGPHGFEKLVALKSIHPHLAKDPRFVQMFLDEARIAARLSHPNACGVIDFGEADGTYFLTMPFLLGEPLHVVQKALRRTEDEALRALSPFVIARLLADACEGLHAAHELRDERGEPLAVVHRDVSPQNLFVGFEGTMSVLDFGVASARHRLHSTATGEVKGKFAYAAPEQLESRAVDRRADVWSLGVVLWEHIAQRRLFGRADAGATIRAVLESPVPPLREHCPDAPLGLEEIVFRALARDPERRYATAREMGRDLLGFLSEEGRGIGSPHVAEWLERLMPTARAQKERLVEQARADVTAADIATAEPPASLASVASQPPTQLERAPAVERRSRGAVLAMVAALGGLTALVVVWFETTRAPGVTARDDGAALAPQREATPPIDPVEVAPAIDPVVVVTDDAVVDERPTEEAVPDEAADDDDPAAPRGRGTVSVATPGGWALVYRGDRVIGEAPGTFAMPSGATTLRIQPFGRGPFLRRRVRVPAGGVVRVSIPVR